MADEEKDFSQEESASIPKSVIYHRSCSQHHRNNLNCQDPPVLNIRITLFFFLMTASNVVQVFTNKQLFKKESFRYAQVTFATFHSTATSLTLWIASRPCVRIFQAKLAPTLSIVPLSTTICLNIILPNLSLQYSSITFYQITRVFLTPCVAALNIIISKTTIPRRASLTLIPVCVGVGMVS